MAQPVSLFRPNNHLVLALVLGNAPWHAWKYIVCGCESWETLPPASRLTTAYQSLNRGDSTLGGLGRAASCSWGEKRDWVGGGRAIFLTPLRPTRHAVAWACF